jgi:D-3-phosphoglycerate dehydrogenase / 2-oxoglutarate reductase
MSKRVHANDGISSNGKQALTEAGFKVTSDFVPQDKLADYINKENVEVLLVRSATKVRKDIIDACPGLKLVGRGGVGMDNIDREYATNRRIRVFNTPASSSISVAELVMAHLFALMRGLHESNRHMPGRGQGEFKDLKKIYEKGLELRGKTLGIIGFGRIGQWTARYALGAGMNVIYADNHATAEAIEMEIGGQTVRVAVKMVPLTELLAKSDAVTLHVPAQKDGAPVLGRGELALMKQGAVLVNTARGGSVDEDALLAALESGKLRGVALDVFTNEPTPRADVLAHPKISLTPHIGAATAEAQGRIGNELADIIIEHYAQQSVDA